MCRYVSLNVDEISPQFCDFRQKLSKYIFIITHRYKSQRNLQNFLQFETNRAEKNVFSAHLPRKSNTNPPPTPSYVPPFGPSRPSGTPGAAASPPAEPHRGERPGLIILHPCASERRGREGIRGILDTEILGLFTSKKHWKRVLRL